MLIYQVLIKLTLGPTRQMMDDDVLSLDAWSSSSHIDNDRFFGLTFICSEPRTVEDQFLQLLSPQSIVVSCPTFFYTFRITRDCGGLPTTVQESKPTIFPL